MSLRETILAKASALIDERVAGIMNPVSGVGVSVQGGVISAQAGGVAREGDPDRFSLYPGQLQVRGNDVFVVPFTHETYSDSYINYGVFEEATLGGISLFNTPRPSFSRLSGGGAVFLAKTFVLTIEYGEVVGRYVSADLIQQALTAPYPRSPGEVNYPLPDWAPVSVGESTSKCYTLIGVYDADGRVYQGYNFDWTPVTSLTDPLDEFGNPPYMRNTFGVAPYNKHAV